MVNLGSSAPGKGSGCQGHGWVLVQGLELAGASIPRVYPALSRSAASSPRLVHHPKAFSLRQANIETPPMFPVGKNLAVGLGVSADRPGPWTRPPPYPLITLPSSPCSPPVIRSLPCSVVPLLHGPRDPALSLSTHPTLYRDRAAPALQHPPTSGPLLPTC